MKALLEDLWDKYQFERSVQLTPFEKEQLKELEEARAKINLQGEREEAFEKYFTLLSSINEERNKNSFFEGIKFGVNFIMETFINK